MPDKQDKHWFYASSIIGCGLSIDDLWSHELTCSRDEVTCPGCLARLRADRHICEACRLGASSKKPHVCDPALVYIADDWPDSDRINFLLHLAFGSRICAEA